MKKRLIAIGLAILLCLTVVSGCAGTGDAIPDEARLYLELTLINLETEGVDDVDAATAMDDVLNELGNYALINAFYAYQLCEDAEVDYYWAQFLNTWAAELGDYLQENEG